MIEMRDRLIELLNDCQHEYDKEVGKAIKENRKPIGENAFYADHLLSAGVIVPPCKVGDYITNRGDAYLLLWRVDVINYYREGQPTIAATHNNVTMTTTFDGIGKVFTKEEAEKALKERRVNDGT